MSRKLETMNTKEFVDLLKTITPLQTEALCGICAAVAAGAVLREYNQGLGGPQLAARVAESIHSIAKNVQ